MCALRRGAHNGGLCGGLTGGFVNRHCFAAGRYAVVGLTPLPGTSPILVSQLWSIVSIHLAPKRSN